MKVLSSVLGSPSWGSGNRWRTTQRIWLWRPVGFDHRNSTGLGETETPLLEVCTQDHMCPRAQGKKHIEPGPDLPASIWGSPSEARSRCGSLWRQRQWLWWFCGIFIGMRSPKGCHFLTKIRPHPTACRLQCWDVSVQIINRWGSISASSTRVQTAEARTISLQLSERKLQSQKVRQNELAEDYVPEERSR